MTLFYIGFNKPVSAYTYMNNTVYPRSSYPFYTVTYYIKRVYNSRTDGPSCFSAGSKTLIQKQAHFEKYKLQSIEHQTETTAIIVTHDQEEALSVCDVVSVLENGKVIQSATPQEIYLNPQNFFRDSGRSDTNL